MVPQGASEAKPVSRWYQELTPYTLKVDRMEHLLYTLYE